MSNTLKTATAVVGLLAGVVAGIYVMGGLVIALRLLFDHFSLQGAVTAVGQLPRESVVAMAMLNVIGPAVAFGLLAACAYGLAGRPHPRGGPGLSDEEGLKRDQLTDGPLWGVVLLFACFLAIAVLGTLPALVEAIQTEHVSPLLVPCIYAAVVSCGIIAVGWYRIRRVAREGRSRLDRALVAGAIWAVVALLPALMLASAKPFETAQVCTTADQVATKGRLIGEGSGKVFLEEEFGKEAALVVLPADQVTKSESGDLSSRFACPLPPGRQAVAKAAEEKIGDHGSPLEVELATALRPRLRFDSHEHWRPLAVDEFARERFSGGGAQQACWLEQGAPPRCRPLEGLAELKRGKEAPDYIEIEGQDENGAGFFSPQAKCHHGVVRDCDEGKAAAIYYRRTTHEGRWYWDYWWFLRYNDYSGRVNECRFYCADHEGDWEGMTVVTTPSLHPEIVGAIYAAHRDRILVDASLLPLSAGHPLVFVANGTHASYPFRCAQRNCEQFGTLAGFRLPEEGHDGEARWGENGDAACRRDECVRPLPEADHPSEGAVPLAGGWAAWPGTWGSTCALGSCSGKESSPHSPGLQIRFKCPWAPTRWALLAPDGTVSRSEPAGDAERLRATCEAQRAGL